jgi:hypothetical protein
MKLLSLHSLAPFVVGLLADSVNDVSSTRKVYLLAVGLAALGIALLIITVWFWRSTRPDPALLAPLEVMGERKFRSLDEFAQQDLLNSVRPEDAQPMRWGVVEGESLDGGVIDLEAAARAELKGFDDLRDADVVEEPAVEEAPAVEEQVVEAPIAEPVRQSDAEPAPIPEPVLDPSTPLARDLMDPLLRNVKKGHH